MDGFRDGLGDAWAATAAFLPKFLGFLLVLVIGYFIAKAIQKIVDGVLERLGFDRWVERGGIKQALARSEYDASSLLARLAFFVVMLFVLQLAFGIFGSNPVSDLIAGVVAYLPNVFAAVLILVVGFAIAAAAREIVQAAIGGLDYGRTLAVVAGGSIAVVAVFAALAQLQIAEPIVVGLFYALLAIIVGSSVVAIGGGGIKTMQRYWDRAADRVEQESTRVRLEAQGAGERTQQRAERPARQVQPAMSGASGRPAPATDELQPEVQGPGYTEPGPATPGIAPGYTEPPTPGSDLNTGYSDPLPGTDAPRGSAAHPAGTGMGNVGEALRRDWEQTKHDLGLEGSRDLDQDAGETLRQARGEEQPPR